MSVTDWMVLLLTLSAMIGYGMHKGRGQDGAHSYLLANRQMPWYVVLLGVMATQASAITFLSAPGLAFSDGMRFVQNYFGLPLAMVVICITFIPVFSRLRVFTAYEFLEKRFDKRTRLFTAFLFLVSRGLSTGISIYAPAIILSSMLGWNIYITNVIMGGLLMVYTWSGGAKAVAHTQKLQFLVILAAMGYAGYLVVHKLPQDVGLKEAIYLADISGKMNVITTKFDWHDKYNIWSGVIGGFFLSLSYFGTDHSQVGRYITAKDTKQSRTGLAMNGIVKVPMQFLILLVGVLVFVFYSFQPAPLYFNTTAYNTYVAREPEKANSEIDRYKTMHDKYRNLATEIAHLRQQKGSTNTGKTIEEFKTTQTNIQSLRDSIARHISKQGYSPDKNDTNYVFLYFIKNSLPVGIVGLLFAVIILASWGSISAALNALAASSLMDIHLRNGSISSERELRLGRLHTLGWGVFCVCIAMFAAKMGSLIEAVNILGSLFYGTILGIFLVAFYMKPVNGRTVFTAAVVTEIAVICIYVSGIVSFLWLNVIGALLMMVICFFVHIKEYLSPGNR